MSLPLRFPDPQDVARERAEEFQRLSSQEQHRQLVDVIETGMLLLRESKNRHVIDQMFLDREQAWQNFQQEFFRRHVR